MQGFIYIYMCGKIEIYAALLKANYPFFKSNVDVLAFSEMVPIVAGYCYLTRLLTISYIKHNMELNWKETFISASQLALFVQIILGECIGIAFAGRGGGLCG